jgi:hypothetical protein
VKLSTADRLILPNLTPEKGNLIDMTAKKDLLAKVALTQEEMKTIGLKENNGSLSWTEECPVDVEFTDFEEAILKKEIKRLDESGEIRSEMVDLCNRIIKL